jgi:hypothetical protein
MQNNWNSGWFYIKKWIGINIVGQYDKNNKKNV